MTQIDQLIEELHKEKCPELNDLQFSIYRKILKKFIYNEEKGICLITGSAGTGKTYAVNKALEYIMDRVSESKNDTIIISAPTNQAVNNIFLLLTPELMELKKSRKYIQYKTLHSSLGYEEVIDGYGNLSFKPSEEKVFEVEERLRKLRLLIVDEGSMVNKEMYNILIQNFKKYKFSIFFVGDPYQLPPIKEAHSLVFDKDEIKKLGKIHETIILTEIIRQRAGHPILDITHHYTHNTTNEDINLLHLLKEAKSVTLDNAGILNLKNNNKKDADLQGMVDILEQYYKADEYTNKPFHIKTIAYTNNCVDTFNDLIRGIVYGEEANKGLVIGEKLILNSPVVIDKHSKKMLHVNQEIVVTDYDESILDINIGNIKFSLKYYDTEISYQDLFMTNYARIKLIHEDSKSVMEAKLDKLKKQALAHPPGGFYAKKAWVEYYTLRDKFFTSTKYAYCVTTHKAQGSTYDNIILILNDLSRDRNPIERNMLTYTAMTRAKFNLILINN